ncbi:MAG: WD40 repeat domain-containing protein [Promethearchaeota archaeon]
MHLERITLEKIVLGVILFSQILILSAYFLFPSPLKYTSSSFSLEVGNEIQIIILAPNDQEFAIGDVLGNILIYNVNGTLLSSWEAHNLDVSSLSYSADDTILVSGGYDGYVKMWNVSTRTNISEIYETGAISSVHILLDNNALVYQYLEGSSLNDFLVLWNLTSGTRTWTKNVGRLEFITLSSNEELITSKFVHRIKGWNELHLSYTKNASTAYNLTNFDGALYAGTFSPNGRLFAAGGSLGEVYVWDLEQVQIIRRFKMLGVINDVIFTSEGSKICTVSGGYENAICLWDLESGIMEKKLVIKSEQIPSYLDDVAQIQITTNLTVISRRYSGKIEYWSLKS